jgi:pilus assembly protein Flp/PilA
MYKSEQQLRSSAMSLLARFIKEDCGATAIEYGLIAALIAVAAISAMTTLGGKLTTTFDSVANQLK